MIHHSTENRVFLYFANFFFFDILKQRASEIERHWTDFSLDLMPAARNDTLVLLDKFVRYCGWGLRTDCSLIIYLFESFETIYLSCIGSLHTVIPHKVPPMIWMTLCKFEQQLTAGDQHIHVPRYYGCRC
jgi:hypothetical protein